jgi:hypothetical protein
MEGIRFVSKNEREQKEDRKKKKHKKEKSKKRDRRREEEAASSDEAEFNVNAEEQRMKELIEAEGDEEDKRSMLMENLGIEGSMKKRKFDRECDDDEDPVVVELSSSTHYHEDHEPSLESSTQNQTPPNDTSTNKGYASLLRARLKNSAAGGKLEPLPKVSSASSTSTASADLTFMSKDEMKWLSSLSRQKNSGGASDTDTKQGTKSTSSLRYQILDDHEADIDSVLISNILKKGANFKGTELGLSSISMSREGVGSNGDRSGKDEGGENGEGEIDMKMLLSKDRKLTEAERAKKIISKAEKTGKIYAQVETAPSTPCLTHLSISQIVDNCSRCRGGRYYRSHRTICSGRHVELRIKPSHCAFPLLLLTPLLHLPDQMPSRWTQSGTANSSLSRTSLQCCAP